MSSPNQEPSEHKPSNDFGNFFSSSNARDVVAYVLLALGIILLFFQPIYGGLLIGLVAGVYFSSEVLTIIRNIEGFIDREGVARSLVLAGLLLGFLISAPAIFVGAAIVIAIKLFITTPEA